MAARTGIRDRIASPLRLGQVGVLLAAAALSNAAATAGVNVWTSHGPDGGYVTNLVISAESPPRLLAATLSGVRTQSGAIWKSGDGGASWKRSLTLGDYEQVRHLALDPSSPAVAYAVTFRGILKTEDGGDHWAAASTVLLRSMAIAPSRPTTIYAVEASGGMLKSQDGALTWGPIASGMSVQSLAVEPDSELTVYAGTYGAGVLKSTDGGATWAPTGAGLPSGPDVQIVALRFDSRRPAGLLALTYEGGSIQSGLYRSTDQGASWSAVFPKSGHYYISHLALGRHEPGVIYLAGGQSVFKSADDGTTWTELPFPAPLNAPIGALVVDPNDDEVVYAGIGAGAGVLRSGDGGVTWMPSSRGMAATGVQALAVGPEPERALHALVQPYATLCEVSVSPDEGGSWESRGQVDTCFYPEAIVVDPSTAEVLYVGGHDGAHKSFDGGRSWIRIANGFREVSEARSLAIDPTTPSILYAGSHRFNGGGWYGQLVYKTTNGGQTWDAASSGLPDISNEQVIDALLVDPRNHATVYAGGLRLWRSTNAGRNWSSMTPPWGGPSSVTAIALDPRNSNTVLCVGTDAVFKTQDGGSSWSKSAPPGGAVALVFDPMNPANLYAGGYGGVSMSPDGGASWTLINGGLPVIHVTALAIDRTGTVLHAATDGAGVFDLELSTATPEISLEPGALTIPAGTSAMVTANIGPPQLVETHLSVATSESGIVSVPEFVTIAAGESSAAFTVTGAVPARTTTITVRLPDSLGGATATATVTVTSSPVRAPRRHLHGGAP